MRIKSIFMILIIVVMLLVFGCTALTNLSNLDSSVKLGNVEFSLPDGYYKKDTTESGHIIITDGEKDITILRNDGTNAKHYIKQYEDYVNGNNQTIKLDDFKVDDLTVYKSTIKQNPKVVHYWFVKNGKTYSMYTSKADNTTEDIIIDMIKSFKAN